MKKVLKLFVFGLFIFLISCNNAGYKSITPEEAYNMRAENSSIIFVDVRDESEYEDGHIQAALLLPLGEIEMEAGRVIPDKTKTYIVYCQSGARALQAVELLVELGYENIYYMGGLSDWDYETVK